MKTLWLLKKGIGVSGLNGIDKLLSFMIVYEMKRLIKIFKKELDNDMKKDLEAFYRNIRNLGDIVNEYQKVYIEARKK